MSDYTVEMFHADYEKVIPIMLKYRDLETLDQNGDEVKPENAVLEILAYFISQYGNSRGTDYEIRFLSVMQFIEHYQMDLIESGLISGEENESTKVPNSILEKLLDSFKSPQPPSHYPSSSLFNQRHELNYKKVYKLLKKA